MIMVVINFMLRAAIVVLLVIQAMSGSFYPIYATTNHDLSQPSGTLTGSWRGGTHIYIKGSGFDQDPRNNHVFVGNFPCEIPAEGVTANWLTCVTTDAGVDYNTNNLVITVTSGSQTYPVEWPKFSYYYYSTPFLYDVTPSAAIASTRLGFYGIHRIQDSGDGARDLGEILGMYIGESQCSLFDINQGTIYPNNAATIYCDQAGIQEAGRYTVLEHVRAGYSDNHFYMRKSCFDGSNFQHTVVPGVESISPVSGFASGQEITITGTGFSTSEDAVQVSVDGVACSVTSSSQSEINCKLGDKGSSSALLSTDAGSQTSGYVSGSGFRYTRYDISSLGDKTYSGLKTYLGSSSLPIEEEKIAFELETYATGAFGEVLKGYFRAPVAGEYTFRGASSGSFGLYIAGNYGTAEVGSSPLIYGFSSIYKNNYYYVNQATALNGEVTLAAGQLYYIEVYHINTGGSGFMKISVEVPNNDDSLVWQRHEVNKITTSFTNDPQILQFVLKGADDGYYQLQRISVVQDPDTGKWSQNTVTQQVNYNATASEFNDALKGLDLFAPYTVSTTVEALDADGSTTTHDMGVEFVYTVTIWQYRDQDHIDGDITYNYAQVTGDNPSITQTTIHPHGPLISGTFTIDVEGQPLKVYSSTTSSYSETDIPFDITASKLENAFNSLGIFEHVQVGLLGDPEYGASWVIQYWAYNHDVADLVYSDIGLEGGVDGTKPEVTVEEMRKYSPNLIFNPVDQRMMRTDSDTPDVLVTVNNVLAACVGSCEYTFISPSPTITALTLNGQKLEITLADAGAYSTSDLIITIDGQDCSAATGTISSFECTLPTNSNGNALLTVGSHMPTIYVEGVGYVQPDQSVLPIDVTMSLGAVTPSSGGSNGGYSVTIDGEGFPTDAELIDVMLCGVDTTITSLTNTQIIITAPQCTTGAQNIEVIVGSATQTIAYSYTSPVSPPEVTSINPTSASPVLKGIMEITGSGFGTDVADITVHLTNSSGKVYEMRVLSVEDTLITCGIPGGLPGDFEVKVNLNGAGDAVANPETADDFVYQLVIESISPTTGSYYGGTLITITGRNFSPTLSQNLVFVSNSINWFCDIQSLTTTEITCRTPAYNPQWSDSVQDVVVTNRLIVDSTCEGSCEFTYDDESTSLKITSLSHTVRTSNTASFTISGQNFQASGNQVVFENLITGEKTLAVVSSESTSSIVVSTPSVEGGYYEVRVRNDPEGESNGFPLDVRTELDSAMDASIKGGYITISGEGLPDEKDDALFSVSMMADGMPVDVELTHSTTQQMTILLQEGYEGKQSVLTLINPRSVSHTITITQTSAATPSLELTSSSTISAGSATTITLLRNSHTGTNPTTIQLCNSINPQVLVDIDSWTENGDSLEFTATLNSGGYVFLIQYDQYGTADISDMLMVTSPSYSASATSVSYAGGQLVVNGAYISENALLKVGGMYGKVISTTGSDATFEIPPLVTDFVVQQTNFEPLKTVEKVTPSQMLSDEVGTERYAFDANHGTSYSSSNDDCWIGIDIGEGKTIQITRVRVLPNANWNIVSEYLKGATIEASYDNSAFDTLATVDQTVHIGWNSYHISSNTFYRYIRLKHTSMSACQVAELQVQGTIYNDVTVSNIDSFTMPTVTYDDGYNTVDFSSLVEYRKDHTPIVSSLSIANGDVYGGYDLTISGEYLDIGDAEVMIDGISCIVDSGQTTASSITCQVGFREELPEENTFEVTIGGNKAIIHEEFEYVQRWSDVRTWGTDLLPEDGDLVYVPKGMSLFVDQTTPVLEAIVVAEGKIIFADESDIEVHAGSITINRGQFRAGTEENPYQNKLTFILYGGYYDEQMPLLGNKGIGCVECKFSMYGQVRTPTWTTIAQTISAGDTTLEVTDSVDWAVGEQIVVAASGFDHKQAEQRTITAISGKIITVNASFVYEHYSGEQMHGGNKLDMKTEVGLLTRNIRVQGDDSSVESEYGAHVMMAGSAENGMQSHIAYSQFTHCGQPKIQGRYCIHFHMNGDVVDSEVKGNAVHHSFARVLTLHAIQYLHVSYNVGYWVKGHNFFIEDGIETDNILEYNLVISSLETFLMMQTDISVASYWVTNPTNHLRFNRAAGGDFYGFWYEIKQHPDGPSATSDICPRGNPLGQSHDNVAHSYVRFGLRIFRLAPRERPCDPIRNDELEDPWSQNPSIESTFYNYLIYKIGESGLLAEETGNMIFENFTIAETKRAGIEFYRTNLTQELVIARDMAIIGESTGNPPDNFAATLDGARGVIGPRTSGIKITDIRFYNFRSNMVILETCAFCDDILLFTNTAHEYLIQDIEYNNVTSKYLDLNGLKREIIYDLDGTFSSGFDNSSRSSATIMANHPHIGQETACLTPTSTSDWDDTLACDETITIRKVMFTNIHEPGIFTLVPMKIQLIGSLDDNATETDYTEFSSHMASMEPMKDKPKSYTMPYVTGRIYNVWWLTGLDFTHLAVEVSPLFDDAVDDAILFKFNYTQSRELYEIKRATQQDYIAETSTLDAADCEFGDYINDENSSSLALCVTSKGKTRPFQYLEVNGIACRYLCPEETEEYVKEDFVRYWSNETQWPGETLPVEGDNVTINGNWTLIMDINPPHLGFLEVNGDLWIEDTLAEAHLIADFIWVRAGSINAGHGQNSPFEGTFTIELRGNKTSQTYAIDPQTTGNKMMVVTGQLNLYGMAPETTWATLTEWADQGATEISVSSVAGWEVGDDIVIGPTFNNGTHHQQVTITDIDLDTKAVTFTPALEYAHYGDSALTVENQVGTLDTRGAVGHISRNINIRSGDDSGWGYSVLVYGMFDVTTWRIGTINAYGVEFQQGGQQDTQKTVLKIENSYAVDETFQIVSNLEKNSFHNCLSYCLDIDNSQKVTVTNNVFYHGRLFHVRALSISDFIFTNNLMIAAVQRPTMNADELIACFASWEQFDSTITIQHNLCQGSDLHGFVLPYIPCDEVDDIDVSENTVGSAKAGFIFNKVSGTCMAAKGIKAYACGIGQIASSPGTEEILYKNFMITDCERAVTLRFGKEGDDRTAYFRDSYIAQISRPSCTDCYGSSTIDCSSNFGLQMLAVTVNGESLPDKFGTGFDVICKQETFDSKAFLFNVQFHNFRDTYEELPQCSFNKVFKSHRSASDITGSHNLFNVSCVGCESTAWAYFEPPNVNDLGWKGGCGEMLCTGKNNYLIHDYNGTFLDQPGILIANNSVIGDNYEGCTYVEEMNGHYCTVEDIGVLEYESIAPDFNTGISFPVYLSYDGGSFTTATNGWRQWEWQGLEPLNKRLNRFVSIVPLNRIYNMTFASQPPIDMRFQFQRRTIDGDNSEFIMIKLHYPRPNSIRVMNRGNIIAPITLLDNNGEEQISNSTCGSNKFFYENNTIHFVVTGDASCQVRVSLTNSVQLTARFEMEVDDFFNLNGTTQFIDRMCALLKITDTSRMKVVGIYTGSTVVSAFIDQERTTDTDTATSNDNDQHASDSYELQALIQEMNQEIMADFEAAGFPMMDLATAVYTHEDEDDDDDDDDSGSTLDEDTVGLIVGLVVGGCVLTGLIIFGVVYKLKNPNKVENEILETTGSDNAKVEHNQTLGVSEDSVQPRILE